MDEILKELQELGLNSYEAKVYLALIGRDSLSVGEISRLSQVPRGRAYDILDKLAEDGLVTLRSGRHRKYSAIEFDLFQQRLLEQNEKRFKEQQQAIDKVTVALKGRFEARRKEEDHRADPLDYIEIIRNRSQIHQRFIELLNQTEKEMVGFVKPPYSSDEGGRIKQEELQIEMLKRGVKIRAIYEIPENPAEKRWRFQDIARTVRWGEEARLTKELPMKMVVFDERTVIYALEDPILGQISTTTLVIEHRSLARSLKILFEYFWTQSEEFHVSDAEGGDGK